jgi:hypothetical protein
MAAWFAEEAQRWEPETAEVGLRLIMVCRGVNNLEPTGEAAR